MSKVCGIIGVSKIEFFNFSGTKRIKENKKKLKYSKSSKFVSHSPLKKFRQQSTIFGLLLKISSFRSLYPVGWVLIPTISSNNNISKTVRVNNGLTEDFLMICRLIQFALVFL